jgi:NTP pyrophosphatase (non-canonical NTP hydrolase)
MGDGQSREIVDNLASYSGQPRDFGTSLTELRDHAFRIAREHGFKDATIGEDLMLMVTELAEAMEDHRHGKEPTEFWYKDAGGTQFKTLDDAQRLSMNNRKGFKPCGIASELADVIIRVLHFSGKHGIDIEKAVKEKMAFNESRPFRHGKKL